MKVWKSLDRSQEMLKWTKYGHYKKEKNIDKRIHTDSETAGPNNSTSQIDGKFTSQTELNAAKNYINTSQTRRDVSVNVSDLTNITSPDNGSHVAQNSERVPGSATENSENSNQILTAHTREAQHFTCDADHTNALSSTTPCFSASTSLSPSKDTQCSSPVTLSDAAQKDLTSVDSKSVLTPNISTDYLKLHTNSGVTKKQSENNLRVSSLKEHPEQSKMASALPDVTTLPSEDREILGPEMAWEEEELTMDQVVDKDNFPCVCSFDEHTQERNGRLERLQPGLKIYSRQPVLLHMRVRKKQARARTIFKDPKGAYYEVGQTIIIPADYQGWFELVPSDFSRSTCFMSIAEVAKAMPRKFFTRSNVKGIRSEGEGETQKFLERKIPAGSVLETRGTFTAKWKTVAETGLLKKKTKEWELQEVTYLKCLDRDQTEILVPLTHKGKFNAIYEKGQLTQNAVYSVKDILTDLTLPIKVRLLFGKAPVVPCIFTGMLVIRNAAFDDSIVGSTVLNTRNVLFEIPVCAPVKVKYVSNDEHFKAMSTYKDAQKLCKKYANVFSTMIKLAPDLDTDQKVIMHVPTDASLMRQVDESLRALDLITDISFAGEPKDYLLDSDAGSVASSEDPLVVPPSGAETELAEFKSRESQTFV